MTKIELLEKIQIHNIKNSNPALVDKYKRYFKEGYDAYGVSQEANEQFIKEITSLEISIELIDQIAQELLKSSKYEDTSIPLLLMLKQKEFFEKNTFEIFSKWFDIGFNNWAHTDWFCSLIIEVFFKKKLITFKDFSDWRFSERKFKRRAVPVSLLKIKKTYHNYLDLFEFIEPMMMDKERVVHQGLGWFLRECWKLQPEITEEFLMKWKDKSSRLIFQYACEKMDKEYKLKFKKTK